MIITRFAPSPTGSLHIGGVRTALFNWLFAKKNKGLFLLRIEDSDQKRFSKESVKIILEAMKWLKLKNDDKVYYQTQRLDRYNKIIKILLSEKKAYYCKCSEKRLAKLREYQVLNNIKTGYDKKCRDLNYCPKDNDNYVVRFKNPIIGSVSWNDAVKGNITISNYELDDIIIKRSNGLFTYNFCAVIDDIDMAITHIIRGDDHINNTPKQINIYNSLNAKIPVFAHVPMIFNQYGKKLSKRDGAINIMDYREYGYLPEAILNYLVRLGWSHGDQEIFSINEMIKSFDLDHINVSPSCFNSEKLKWLNSYYIKNSKFIDIESEVKYHFLKENININNGPILKELVEEMSKKVHTLTELVDKSSYFYKDNIIYDKYFISKYINRNTLNIFNKLLADFNCLNYNDWKNLIILKNTIIKISQECSIKLKEIIMPLRIAITGSNQSPDISVTLKFLGKDRVINRLKKLVNNFYLQ